MKKQAYVTLMGRSGWAVVNSFYATIIETDYRPERITILFPTQYNDEVKPVIEGLKIIQETYTTPDISSIEVPDWDSLAAGKKALEVIQEYKATDFEVSLDITGGRKALVAGALLALKDQGLEHVYYLAIETTTGVAKPYLMIPKRIQKLFDLMTNEEQNENLSLDPKTGLTDIIMSRDCVQILSNHAFARDEKMVLKAPLIGVDLFEINLQNRELFMKTKRSDYEKHLVKACDDWDHPTYSDLRRCLCFCGVLDYENGEAFKKMLTRDLVESDPLSGSRRAALALDSNMFYNGFPSYLERLERELNLQPKDILCVTPHPVVKEVGKSIRDKYGKRRIYSARDYYKTKGIEHLIDEFIGQNTLRTRVTKMAKSELTKMRNRPVHIITRKVQLPSDKEEVDQLIVDELEAFASERRLRIVLTSSDKNIHDHGDLADDVGTRILQFPVEIPQVLPVTDETIVNLLVGLSLLYGVIEIKKFGYMFGEYRGKQAEVYMDEVKFRLRNLHRAQILKKRVETCKKLLAIGLTK